MKMRSKAKIIRMLFFRCLSDIERGESKKISTTIYRALDNANRIDAREDKGHREKCPPLSGYDCQKKRPPESDCNIDSDCQGHQEAGSLTRTFVCSICLDKK